MTSPITLCAAPTPQHLEAVTRIYAHYVAHSTATFECEAPTPEEMTQRCRAVLEQGLPYIVACVADQVVGYGYAAPYRARPAYDLTVENTVYLQPQFTGRGFGGVLLDALIEKSAAAGKRQMVAVIGGSDNVGSIALHTSRAFEHVGTLRNVGFKFGRFIDTIIMQRALRA